MTFDLISPFTPFLVVFFSALALGVAIVAGLAVATLVGNRRVRVARHESIPAYYRKLALGH